MSTTRKDTFSSYHPLVNLIYFTVVLLFGMFVMHPVFLSLALACSLAYSFYLNGSQTLVFSLKFLLPIMIITALLNPIFNHQGATILTYLKSGNPLTLESILYGIAAAVMLIAVITWFSCFNAVMTSDKLVYLLGRIIPALSLVLSMTLRFIPRFNNQLKLISAAHKTDLGNQKGLLNKAKYGLRILSIMMTWALENSLETADSLKSRGYGLKGRTAFSIYTFKRRDLFAILFMASCTTLLSLGLLLNILDYRYFPTVRFIYSSIAAQGLFLIYAALCLTPLLINLKEDRKWKALQSKI